MVCTKNFCAGKMGHFGPKDGAYPHNSESNLRFLKKILQNERANSYMNILLVVFREKKSFGII